MKLYIFIIILIILSIVFNIFNYAYFNCLLSITWCIASILIITLSIKFTYRFNFIQLKFNKILNAIKSKSENSISPLSSLCVSLAAKIGVGSLSGVALCLYFGGLGSIFWLCFISVLVSINTYLETLAGIKYRVSNNHSYFGGPTYYIRKCLKNKKMGTLYGIIIIITYGVFFLSIQSNTIINALSYFKINKMFLAILLCFVTFLVIMLGLQGISKINSILVPIMLLFYLFLGGYVFLSCNNQIIPILLKIFKEAFNLRSIIPAFLIGMQRAIFITESSIGTSAISAAACLNNPKKQALLEVLGIYLVTFLVCFTTFLIIATSDYQSVNFTNINGIEIVMYAFNYHFGTTGTLFLTIITILFAFSTIISSYYFGESNLNIFKKKKLLVIIFKIVFLCVLIISCYINSDILWNLCDYFVALLAIINVSALLKICKNWQKDNY